MARTTERAHPFDEAPPGRRLVLRPSLRAEAAPPGGVVDPPFYWPDLTENGPFGDEERGPPVLCVPGPELVFATTRVENPLLVRVVEARVEVEDRLAVTERRLPVVLEAERAVVGQRLEDAGREARARARRADHPLAARMHAAHAALAGGARRVTRGLASLPDRTVVHAQRAATFLSTRDGRARFARGLFDPHGLDREQKAVTFFVLFASVLVSVAVLHFAVTLIVPDAARAWRTVMLLFLYIFGSAFGAPLPIEPIIVAAALAVGAPLAIGVSLVAKVLAAWLVFFIGDEIHHRLLERSASRPRLARFLDVSERFAQRFGLAAVAVFIATPGLPDFVPLYLFSSLHMKLGKFLAGVAIGALVLYSVFTLGVLHLLG